MKFKKLLILCIFSFCSAIFINQHEPTDIQSNSINNAEETSNHVNKNMDNDEEVTQLDLNLRSIISLL